MNEAQAGTILGIAAGFDRYIVLNPLNTAAWHSVLKDYEFDDVQSAVHAYYELMWDGKTQLAPRVLLEEVRNRIATDVRVARRAGLVGRDWPDSQRLSPAVQRDITVYRSALAAWERQNPIGFNNHEPFDEWCARNGYNYETKDLATA